MNLDKNKVVLGLSGGVDSTACAKILKERGYEVVGVTMLLFDDIDEEGKVVVPPFLDDAKRAADRLGIEHRILDIRGFFKENVRDYFIDEYLSGRTPNPCVVCNKKVKFGKLVEYAHEIGAYYVSTGHYAKVEYDKAISRYRVFRGSADRKDQAYVLHSLSQEQLKHIMFPLSEIEDKEDVRKIAFEVDSEISNKADSVGVCFIPGGNHKSYIAQKAKGRLEEGVFRHKSGSILGMHKGISNYTIGQKRGLGIKSDKELFVVSIDPEKNEVVLGDDIDTYSNGFVASGVNFIPFERPDGELRLRTKVCHWGYYLDCSIKCIEGGFVQVEFDEPQRAVTPGQAAVFYDGREIVGGATIEKVIR